MADKPVHVILRIESGDQTTDPVFVVGVTTLGESYAEKRRVEAAEEEMLNMLNEGADNQDDLDPDQFLKEVGVEFTVVEAPLLQTGL